MEITMKCLLKTVICSISLLNGAVYADGIHSNKAWDIGVDVLYLLPITTNNEQVYSIQNAINNTYKHYSYPWDWGYKVEGSYHFSAKKDVSLNWSHVDNFHDDYFSGLYHNNIESSISLPSDTLFNTSTNPRWDAVNLEMAHSFLLYHQTHVRVFGGVSYARVHNETVLDIGVPNDFFRGRNIDNSLYNGFGPRVGAKFELHENWMLGFSPYVNTAASVFAGPSSVSRTKSYISETLPRVEQQVFASSTTIVPALEMTLGLNYYCRLKEGLLTLDLGWMWINYFNAQQGLDYNAQTVIFGDFGLQGLRFGLNWMVYE